MTSEVNSEIYVLMDVPSCMRNMYNFCKAPRQLATVFFMYNDSNLFNSFTVVVSYMTSCNTSSVMDSWIVERAFWSISFHSCSSIFNGLFSFTSNAAFKFYCTKTIKLTFHIPKLICPSNCWRSNFVVAIIYLCRVNPVCYKFSGRM